MSLNPARARERQVRRSAARSSRPYALAVLVIGWLGYAWTAAILVLLLALAVFAVRTVVPRAPLVSVPFVLLAALAGLFLTAAFRVRVEPPVGVRLAPNLTPALHSLIQSLRGPLRVRPFRDVLLGTGMEVRTVRVPRLAGLLGFHDYLVVGLPLMLALPIEQLHALLAHELAHSSRRGRVRGAAVYRLRSGWLCLLESLATSRSLYVLPLRPFFRTFAPWYASISAPVARDHELAADRRAALTTSRDQLAGALIRLGVIERFMVERFQPKLLSDLRLYGVPPTGLSRRFEQALDGVRDDSRFDAWVDTAIHRDRPPAQDDTHPPLRQRLSALALSDLRNPKNRALIRAAFGDEHAGESSASISLAAVPEAVRISVEKAWVDAVERSLADRHEELLRLDERRRQLAKKDGLTPVERLDHAIATAETDGIDAAIPLLEDLIDSQPDMAPARFVLGTLMLRKNDAAGLTHIHTAVRMDPDLDEAGRELAAEYVRAAGGYDAVAVADPAEPPGRPGTNIRDVGSAAGR